MFLKKISMAVALFSIAATCFGQFQGGGNPQDQSRQGGPQMPQGRSWNEDFFQADLIMQNQQSLGLSEEQKTAIKEIMKKSISDFTELQWQQCAEQEAMSSLSRQEKVDEEKTIAQLDKLLNIENQIKKLQLSTLIKVKNLLTAEQQRKLRFMRSPMGGMMSFMGSERRGFGHGDRGGDRNQQQGNPPAQKPTEEK